MDYDNAGKGCESVSQLDSTVIARNIGDRVAADGTRDVGLLQLLNMIQMDVRNGGITPGEVIVREGAGAVTGERILFCPAGSRIIIYDCRLAGAATGAATFEDQDGNAVFAGVYIDAGAIIAGGFSSARGIFLPAGKSIYLTVTVAAAWVMHLSYAMVPTIV